MAFAGSSLARTTFPFTALVGQDAMKQALVLNAINPAIGGVLIRGEKGTAKSTAVRALARPGRRAGADGPAGSRTGRAGGHGASRRGGGRWGEDPPRARRRRRGGEPQLTAPEARVPATIATEAPIKRKSTSLNPTPPS